MLSEALGIDLSDFEIENVMWKCDSLWQVVKIVIGGVPHVIEVRFMYLSLSVGRMLLQSLVLTNQMEPMRNQVVFGKLKSASYSLESSISWLNNSRQRFT
jgi:hypothetical protein